MSFSSIIDKTFIINLDRRKDRWDEMLYELIVLDLDYETVDRWQAYDSPGDGHYGCTRSHRELLAHVASGPWTSVLVLEDDCALVTKDRLKAAGFCEEQQVYRTHCSILNGEGNLVERFEALEPFLPPQWDVLYLGAGYGEPPISRYSQHCLRVGFMQTTSSYAISREFARKWTAEVNARYPSLEQHPGPIDNLFGLFARRYHFYCLQPRLLFQGASLSDITRETNSYLFSMTDPVAESSL